MFGLVKNSTYQLMVKKANEATVEVESLNKEVADKYALIVSRAREISVKDKSMSALNEKVMALNDNIARLEKLVVAKDCTIKSLESSQKALRVERDNLSKKVKLAEETVAELEEVVNLLTTPMETVDDVLEMECHPCCEPCGSDEPMNELIAEEVSEVVEETVKTEPTPIISKSKKKKRK